MNLLIAYFSASGRTKLVAKKLANELKSDIYEIKPTKEYTKEDLDWKNKNSRSSLEMKNKDSRPEIIKNDIDILKYDKILLGFPIWWYTSPTIINSFLETYDFSNKEIILWATSGGSSFGKTVSDLEKSTSAKITQGMILNDDLAIDEFIKNIRS